MSPGSGDLVPPWPTLASGYPSGYATTRPLGRPILVSILAILIGLVGIFVVLVGALILAVGLGVLPSVYVLLQGTGILHSGLIIFGAFWFILGIIMLAVARGLWDQEMWALVTCAIIVTLELISSFLSDEVVLFVVFLLLLIYLVAVRHHFS